MQTEHGASLFVFRIRVSLGNILICFFQKTLENDQLRDALERTVDMTNSGEHNQVKYDYFRVSSGIDF